MAKISGYGSALVTASGKSVYLLSTDPAGSSKCTGTCAKTWIPVTVSGSPSAGSGVDSSKLSTFKRSDGTTQVLYNKQALYTFTGQGSTSGEGQASFGGVWYLVAPERRRDQEEQFGRLLSTLGRARRSGRGRRSSAGPNLRVPQSPITTSRA